MSLLDWFKRQPLPADAWQATGFELVPEFHLFADDPQLSQLLRITRSAVVEQGGPFDPGFSMLLKQPHERLWFGMLVRLSVAGNREALGILADFAPTDSARLWALNPPSCRACGAVLPHHAEDCSVFAFIIDDESSH